MDSYERREDRRCRTSRIEFGGNEGSAGMKRRLCVLLLTGVLALGTAGISHADYMIGSQGPEVRNLQKRLNVYGFKVKADGNFNVATCNAVKKFQRRKHLSVDGIVGPVTYKALMAVRQGECVYSLCGHR